ncbi:MAG: hypothetical protein KFB95_06065 [Simkaniaceae bacterium]|nr:MAG: hypothetical protein KFB95_06065 [Simkaniaceae bacterium]
MTQYNSVSGVRFGLQMATAALFYAAARYKKVDGLTSAASRIGIAAVVQGVSQRVHAPLGERTKMNWLADGISLGLVAYGMSYTDLAKRTKYLAGAALFGSQLVISNLKPNTALARIDKIETKEECAEIYEELKQLFAENKETITPEQSIKTCKAFFQKAVLFSRDDWRGSPASRALNLYSDFLNKLQGWGKVKAQMEYIEVINAAGVFNSSFVNSQYFTEHLGEGEQAQFDLWMEKTGRSIQLRWSTWDMEKAGHQEVYETITGYINGIGDKITFAQKIDLCEQFYIKSRRDHSGEDFRGSPPQNMLVFRERLMGNLEGMEKAKAYMAYAEFLAENHTSYPDLFNRIIPEIRAILDENGQAAVDAWMAETGTAIQEKWRR